VRRKTSSRGIAILVGGCCLFFFLIAFVIPRGGFLPVVLLALPVVIWQQSREWREAGDERRERRRRWGLSRSRRSRPGSRRRQEGKDKDLEDVFE